MKRCPTCQRIYTDEVKFCRVDGVTLVNTSAGLSESEATRVLPESRATGEAPTEVLRDTGEGKLTTSALKPGAASAAIGAPRRSIGGRKLTLIVALIVLIVVVPTVIVIAGYVSYRHARNTEVAIDSIAVLPFENQNRDAGVEWLSDGVTESIMNNLAQLPNLRVSPRSTVFRYKGKETDALAIGKELGVRAVLTGRLLQRGDSLTISTELLDVRDNKQVWGEQYNRRLADALAVQQEISREITDRLRLKLSGEEHRQLTRRDTANPEAYQFYLKGRYYWNKRTAENLKKAMEQFQQAADKDPNYALAYVGLADCYLLLQEYAGTPASETGPNAKAFAQRAVQLDESLAEAHTSLAYSYDFLWQWEEAEAEFKQAIRLNPNYPTAHQWYSLYLRDTGRFDQAMTETKRAQELDPLSLVIGQNLAAAYLFQGDVNSSVEQIRRVLDLDPNYPRGHDILGLAYLKQGHYSEAIAEVRNAVDLSFRRDRRPLSDLGYSYAISGRRAEALAVLKDLQAKYEKHEALGRDLTAVYVGLGDKDQAFAWLEKDFQAHNGQLARIRWEPPFESLRSDPRFAGLLRRMGLKP
jgi:TolB-like protein/Flp pilus assembly protein TadD